jgi:hypothetical protein
MAKLASVLARGYQHATLGLVRARCRRDADGA